LTSKHESHWIHFLQKDYRLREEELNHWNKQIPSLWGKKRDWSVWWGPLVTVRVTYSSGEQPWDKPLPKTGTKKWSKKNQPPQTQPEREREREREITSTRWRFEARLKRTKANSPICASKIPTYKNNQIFKNKQFMYST
jgi:hypothetical protein